MSTTYTPSFRTKYVGQVVPALKEQMGYKNPMEGANIIQDHYGRISASIHTSAAVSAGRIFNNKDSEI